MLNCHPLSNAAADLQLVYAAGNATGQALALDDFYSNELVKNYYKNHVSFIMNHVNKYTGLQFKVWVASIAMSAPSSSADWPSVHSTCCIVGAFQLEWLY